MWAVYQVSHVLLAASRGYQLIDVAAAGIDADNTRRDVPLGSNLNGHLWYSWRTSSMAIVGVAADSQGQAAGTRG